MTEFICGVLRQAEHYDVFPVEISPPENTKVELKQIVGFNGPYEFTLLAARIGVQLLPFKGEIDLAFFSKHHRFEFGAITEEDPLRLYCQVFGTPSIFPYLNFAVVGEMSEWTAPVVDEAARHQVKELSLNEYATWLRARMDVDQVKALLDPAEAFVNGDGDLERKTEEPKPQEKSPAVLPRDGIYIRKR